MTALWLTRARLRQDPSLAALAEVLLPDHANDRIGMSHRLVWTLFGDTADRRRDFLWREDRPGQFIVLSARPPAEGLLLALDSKPFSPRLEPGDRLAFTMRVNPTVTHAVPGRGMRGKRNDVVMDALKPIALADRASARPDLVQSTGTAWLRLRAAPSGFALRAVRADNYDQIRLSRGPDGKGPRQRPLTFSVLDLEGELEVTDPALFLRSLAAGFGRAKAFGCGLMLIRRAG